MSAQLHAVFAVEVEAFEREHGVLVGETKLLGHSVGIQASRIHHVLARQALGASNDRPATT